MEISVKNLPVSLIVPSLSAVNLNTVSIKAVMNAVPLPPLDLVLASPQPLSMSVSDYGVISEIEFYNGSYRVTPQAWDEVILETKGKAMRDDVTVEEIPYYRTSNPSGGDTIFIGYQGVYNG